MSDKIGRKLTLMIVFGGITLSFLSLGFVSKEWSIVLVVDVTIIGGIFSKAGSGAVIFLTPVLSGKFPAQRSVLLTANSLVGYDQFFMFIGIVSAVVFVIIVVFL